MAIDDWAEVLLGIAYGRHSGALAALAFPCKSIDYTCA